MACHNELSHTKKGVRSILENSPPDRINFVFIDNGSTDGTYTFLKNIPNSFIIRNHQNVYVNPAWNQGFKHVLNNKIGEYVCLINNDIQVAPKWLEPIFWLFETNVNEFYLPASNTQDNPAFGSESEFITYSKKCWDVPLALNPVFDPFVGFCFFMRKEHVKLFYPVPEQMKVLRGDDWITDCLFHNGILPYRVSRCPVHHFNGATQRGLPIHDLRNQDCEEFNRLYQTEYKKRGMGRIFERKMRIPLL